MQQTLAGNAQPLVGVKAMVARLEEVLVRFYPEGRVDESWSDSDSDDNGIFGRSIGLEQMLSPSQFCLRLRVRQLVKKPIFWRFWRGGEMVDAKVWVTMLEVSGVENKPGFELVWISEKDETIRKRVKQILQA
jgi:hypothetical protein